jgi:hypothetical protein
MSVCYFEANKNNLFNRRNQIDNYKFTNIKINTFQINSNNLNNIMKNILLDFCNADVLGFDTRTNKYWCKILENKCCMLNVELEILYKDPEHSLVRFIPLIGSEFLVENFISNFKESIQLYTTSSFIKACLDEKICH